MLPWYMCKSIPLPPETTKTQARWIEVDPIYRDYCAELLPEINCAKAINLTKHNLNERHKEQSDRFYMVWSNWRVQKQPLFDIHKLIMAITRLLRLNKNKNQAKWRSTTEGYFLAHFIGLLISQPIETK